MANTNLLERIIKLNLQLQELDTLDEGDRELSLEDWPEILMLEFVAGTLILDEYSVDLLCGEIFATQVIINNNAGN